MYMSFFNGLHLLMSKMHSYFFIVLSKLENRLRFGAKTCKHVLYFV